MKIVLNWVCNRITYYITILKRYMNALITFSWNPQSDATHFELNTNITSTTVAGSESSVQLALPENTLITAYLVAYNSVGPSGTASLELTTPVYTVLEPPQTPTGFGWRFDGWQ